MIEHRTDRKPIRVTSYSVPVLGQGPASGRAGHALSSPPRLMSWAAITLR
jgi:hypothetical protein